VAGTGVCGPRGEMHGFFSRMEGGPIGRCDRGMTRVAARWCVSGKTEGEAAVEAL
jgi:hypothetical protein